MNTLAKRIQHAMLRKGCSQADIAKACGITPTSVNNWLSGASQSLKAVTAIKAATFLDVPVDWLTSGAGNLPELVNSLGDKEKTQSAANSKPAAIMPEALNDVSAEAMEAAKIVSSFYPDEQLEILHWLRVEAIRRRHGK